VVVEVGRFVAAGLIALIIVALATAVASRRVGQREAIANARTTTVTKAQGIVASALTDAAMDGSPADLARVDAAVRSDVLDRSLVRVKLWDENGKIVYSDEPRLIGQTYDLGDDERSAFTSGKIEAEVSDLGKPENLYERDQGKLLEVYLPIQTPSGRTVLFEAYYRYGLVVDKGTQLWRSFAPITLGALIALELVQIPLAYSLARRLRQRSQEREALLRQALEASDVERRHIASDLHDGVVQDLAGAAYALSAEARRTDRGTGDERGAAVAEEAAEIVRSSIRSLRSLVVDIYPPDFGEVTLESALTDLLARAAEGGLETSLDVEGLADPLPDAVARLLYRAAQEGLRNVVNHAEAASVSVTVATRGTRALLDIVDDGHGFDPDRAEAARRSGHLGLTALRGLITDAGGKVQVDSAVGEGTTLHVEIWL
jgi:two-component system, NarL family, sensor kinase